MKKIMICLLLFLGVSFIAFSQSSESEYVVTITYSDADGKILTEKLNVLSPSGSEAEKKATGQWEALKQSDWIFKFANAEKIDEPIMPQVVAPQTFGYLKMINANPQPQNLSQSHYTIEAVYIKTSTSSEWDPNNYLGGSIHRERSVSIALGTGIYDIRVILGRDYFMPNVGTRYETVTVETRNVPIREDMATEVTMRSGSLSVSQPKRE